MIFIHKNDFISPSPEEMKNKIYLKGKTDNIHKDLVDIIYCKTHHLKEPNISEWDSERERKLSQTLNC